MNKSCDVRDLNRMPTASDWEAIDAQIDRLYRERTEAMAKIMRLDKQEALLRERKQKMIAAGLSSMDELDELEEKEREEQEALGAAQLEASVSRELAGTTNGPNDWVGSDPFAGDPSALAMSETDLQALLDSFGGTPQAMPGG